MASLQDSSHDINNYAIVILAAGSSSRMGSSKQLLPIEDETLLLRTSKAAIETEINNIVVVLGSNEIEHRRVLQKYNIKVVFNPDWENGIGSSLKTGLTFVLNVDSKLKGILILVCDQPYLTPKHLLNLITKHHQSQKPIVASSYSDTAGVPVFFEQRYFRMILQLNDEQGAKTLIFENMHDAEVIDFQQGHIDLDTPEDYQSFLKNHKP